MLLLREVSWNKAIVIHLEGPLRAPVTDNLRRRIRKLIDCGNATIMLDLSGVSHLDAAGIGELVDAYNMTVAANGSLRIAHANGRVQRILNQVGLFGVLSDSQGG